MPQDCDKGVIPIRVLNGVAVVHAKTSLSLIEPYRAGVILERNSPFEQKHEVQENSFEKSVNHGRSNSSMRNTSPKIDPKDIKNIYVDTCNPTTSKKVGSLNSPKVVVPSESKDIIALGTQKQGSAIRMHAKTSMFADAKSFFVPTAYLVNVLKQKIRQV
ncbi:hypothetical protein ACH5RR_000854 [Cinchona calisaya]|uniref:Uncharacterized protein n=1 Tax=Cinchona calisaya TaxID=153742 RepID=A0ABD3B1W8_9GENT